MQKITPEFIREVRAKASLLITKEEIDQAVERLASEVRQELKDQNPIILTLMSGGLFTAAEICLHLDFPLEMDYIHTSRYDGETKGQNIIKWKKEPNGSLAGRHVLLIDDILDGGITLQHVRDYCLQKNAKEVYTLVLLDKKEARLPSGLKEADFTGIEIPNEYVFGYGLDYHNYLRNVAGIYAVAKEHLF